MNKTIIIAEAGVNHNGDINIAKKLINAAVEINIFWSSRIIFLNFFRSHSGINPNSKPLSN